VAATSVNRETIRDAFAALLNSALVGTGKPADAVYGYLHGDPFAADVAPIAVVVVTSSGSERTGSMGAQTFDVWVYLDVWVYVLYADPANSWTEANAEDKRDLIEKSIADVVQDNTSTTSWDELQYAGRTTATDVQIEGGATYFVEQIPIRVHVFQG
jgi:hypothetical protein